MAIPFSVLYVIGKLKKLYSLSKDYALSEGQTKNTVADKIVSFSASNPKWIMLVTQTYSALSIILLISKFVL